MKISEYRVIKIYTSTRYSTILDIIIIFHFRHYRKYTFVVNFSICNTMEGRRGDSVYEVNEDQRNMGQVQQHSYEVHLRKFRIFLRNNCHNLCFHLLFIQPVTGHLADWQTGTSAKYLGVNISSSTWNEHIDVTTKKASQALNFVRRNFSQAAQPISVSSATKHLRRQLGYASSIWDISKVKSAQLSRYTSAYSLMVQYCSKSSRHHYRKMKTKTSDACYPIQHDVTGAIKSSLPAPQIPPLYVHIGRFLVHTAWCAWGSALCRSICGCWYLCKTTKMAITFVHEFCIILCGHLKLDTVPYLRIAAA